MGGNLDADVTLPNEGVPYVVAPSIIWLNPNWLPTTTAVTLTIQPGTTLKFASSGLLIGFLGNNLGILKAQGTASAPITFTTNNATPSPGQWQWGGILFFSTTPASILDHCVIEYGGNNISILYSSPTIQNSTIRKSNGRGIHVYNGSPIIEHNMITENNEGIVVESTSGYEGIRHNNIAGNTTAGLISKASSGLGAHLNWWGNDSGPSGIGPGSGDAVAGDVLFEPWLGAPFTEPFEWTQALNSPDPVTQAGGWTTFFGTLSESGNWTVTLKDSVNTAVKTFVGTGTSFAQDWLGDDTSTSLLPDGTYTYQFDAVSTGTGQPASPAIGRVTLDNTLPIANMTSPTPNQLFSPGSIVNIRGTASGTDFSSYKVEYGAGPSPTFWTQIVASSTSVTNALLASWDTTGLSKPVYTLRLTVTTTTGQTASELVTVRMPLFSDLSALPIYFSPNSDGVKDATRINAALTFLANWNWTLSIKDNTGVVIKTFTGNTSNSRLISQEWNGTDANGVTVSEGVYTYQFQGTHVETGVTTTSAVGKVTVDVTPPTTVITSPVEGQLFLTDDPILFVGTADDVNLSSYSMGYGAGASPSAFTTLDTFRVRVSSGTVYTLDFNRLRGHGFEFPPGTYTFRLRVEDWAGNVSRFDRQITFDYLHITDVSASPSILDPILGEASTLQYTLNLPADVIIRIYDELSKQLVRTFELPGRPQGKNTVTWDGKDATGKWVPEEAYFFSIEARGAAGRKGTFNDPASPSILDTGFSVVEGAVFTPSEFDPFRNDLLQIEFSYGTPARIKAVITSEGRSIKTLSDYRPFLLGKNSLFWDGRKEDGTMHKGEVSVFFEEPKAMVLHPVIIQGDALRIDNFRAEPYLIQPLRGEVTVLTYTLSHPAKVNVVVLKPDGSSFKTLVVQQDQTVGSHSQEWNGRGDQGKLPSVPGSYTVLIEATDPETGITVQRKGIVMIYR